MTKIKHAKDHLEGTNNRKKKREAMNAKRVAFKDSVLRDEDGNPSRDGFG